MTGDHDEKQRACKGDDNCIECAPEVEVSMPGTIANLEADVERLRAERDAMRPVVEAAARLHDCMDDDTYDDLVLAIGQAIVKMRTASSLPANRHK